MPRNLSEVQHADISWHVARLRAAGQLPAEAHLDVEGNRHAVRIAAAASTETAWEYRSQSGRWVVLMTQALSLALRDTWGNGNGRSEPVSWRTTLLRAMLQEQSDGMERGAICGLRSTFADSPSRIRDPGREYRVLAMESTEDGDNTAKILDLALQSFNEYDDKKYDCSPQYHRRLSDLEKCIRLFQNVVALTPPGDRHRLLALRGLGEAYLEMFNETGNMEDADKSLESHKEAMRLTPEDDIGLLNTLKQMGKTYHDRYNHADQATDREQGIYFWESFIENASAALADGNEPGETGLFDTEWIHWCGLLGDLYLQEYRAHGDMGQLERSIELMHQSINQDAEGEGNKGVRIFHLGVAYGNKHQATGNMNDLNQCIASYFEAESLLSPDHPDKPGLMKCLGVAYRDRHEITNSSEDFALYTQYAEAAAGLQPRSDSDHAGRLAALGSVYEDKYRRTHDAEDLNMSFKLKKDALACTPINSDQRAERLSSLANCYSVNYSRTKDVADLDQSIQLNQEALDITPEDHPDRAYRSNNLGMNYHARFKHKNEQFMGQPSHLAHLIQNVDMADLERSIQLKKSALSGTSAEDPCRASRLSHLAEGYEEQYYVTDDESDWEQALHLLEEALACSSSYAQHRLTAGLDLVDKYTTPPSERWPQAYKAASATMELITALASPSLETSDKLVLLDQAAALGPNFAAIALNCGESPFAALQRLERGRGIISKFKNELRVEESRLREARPDLADELASLRAQTEAPPKATPERGSNRYDAGQKLEALMKTPGKPRFDADLLTLSEDELRAATERGPIVTINITPFRCDALIVNRSCIWALPLPDLKFEDIIKHRRDRAKPQVLEWLWTTLAKPVLDELGFTQTPLDDCWPHVWWIPTGILSNFPIHAAGLYSQSPWDGTLDRVISSYGGTIHMLLHTRSRSPATVESTNGEKIVLVAMDKTPGKGDLEFASQEVARVESICKNSGFHVIKPRPMQRDVLTALDHCKIFHFAGHGQSHHSRPLQSTLLLEDWKTNPLTVSILCEADLCNQKPFLAYLSACSTGHMDHGQDEGLHLIGACQIAGFRHVIGTLWEVQDQTCADVAGDIYKWIQREGLNDDSVSDGLHHAVRDLRNQSIRCRRSRGAEAVEHYDVALMGQNPSRAQRDVQPESVPHELFWVPVVHFGV